MSEIGSTTFRTISESPPPVERSEDTTPPPVNNRGAQENPIPEPVHGEEARQVVLDVMGIDDEVRNMPNGDVENLNGVTEYLMNLVRAKGKIPNALTLGKELDNLKLEMDMDDQTEPQVVLDRIGGIFKAWKQMTFIRDPAQKRSLFMKLARQKDSKAMDRLIFEEMEKRAIWR